MLWLTLFLAAQLIPRTAIDYRQPQLAAVNGSVAVTFAAANTIYFALTRDGGKTWGEPVAVAEPGVLSLGNHRGPRLVVTHGAMVISAIAGKQGKGADGDLLTWRSTDNGKSWTQGTAVSDKPGASREGLHAMAASPDGHLFATWLDLRNVQAGKPGTELWGSTSTDAGATWSKNFPVYKSTDGTICQCCHPSAMFAADGTLLVMWRNALGGDRDMYVIRSKDGGSTFGEPQKLGVGSWKIDACPMDGGGLVQGVDGKIMTVWRREKQIYLAPEGAAETALHEGKNPSIATGTNGLYVAWTSPEGVFARVPGHAEPVLLDHEGAFVTLASIPSGGAVAAWERKGTIQFHTLP